MSATRRQYHLAASVVGTSRQDAVAKSRFQTLLAVPQRLIIAGQHNRHPQSCWHDLISGQDIRLSL